MILALFIILVLTGGFLLLIKNQKGISFFALLLILASTYLMLPILSPLESGWSFIGAIGGVLTISFILGSLLHNKWLKIVTPFILIVLLMFTGDSDLSYGSYTLNLSESRIMFIFVLGALLMALLDMKVYAISKLFAEIEIKVAERSVVFLIIGLFSILATFLASWFGFFLMGIGAFVYNAFSEHKRDYISISLVTISVVAFFMAQFSVDTIDLTVGKIIAGFIIGAGVVGVTSIAQTMLNKMIALLLLLASGGLLILVLILNGIHPAYGGIEAFIAALIGIGVAGLFYQNNFVGSFLLPLAIVIGISLSSDPFENSEIALISSTTNAAVPKSNIKKSFVDIQEGLSLDEIIGNYVIEESTSVISFQLGPKGGVTKGEMKGFKGKVTITEKIENSTFNITIPVINVSTFNAMRDESLMDDTYFNEAKFPTMTFSSNEMTQKEDGYLVKGKFTMLGKSNTQEVFLKYVGEKDGKQILVGEAALDKTKFGMAASPQEGDIVSFTFQSLLVK